MAKIIVAGSMNMDIVTRVNRFPLPGETVHGLQTKFYIGGKGANQAVAAARMGANVTMAGCLGNDMFGKEIHKSLLEDGINLSNVKEIESTTGLAIITIDHESGENNIILNKGSNGHFHPNDLDGIEWADYDAVLLQNEIPWETNASIMERAKESNIKTVYNPAPFHSIPESYFRLVDLIILNEIEATEITTIQVNNQDKAIQAAQELIEKGVNEVIVTLGRQGSVYVNGQGVTHMSPSFNVKTIDTTAAGDTFIGAFISAFYSTNSISKSLDFASASAAIAVTTEGAQSSIPNLNQVNEFLSTSSK